MTEIHRGSGLLMAGGIVLRDVPYRLTGSVAEAPRTAPTEGAGQTEGTLDIGGLPEATVLAGVDDLVLQLQDGRRLTVTLTSSTGHFVVRGVGIGDNAVREFARRYTEAWCSRDATQVAAFFTPNGTLAVNDATRAGGREAIAEVARGFMHALPDLRVFMDGVEPEGDRFLFRWTLAGTGKGPGGGDRPVRISGSESWRLSDEGLIAESIGRFDAAEYQRQLEG